MSKVLLVAGSGLSGAVIAERFARALGWRVLVVEARKHIAGNTYDELDRHGVLVHRYGPHIVHTNSAKVWRYLSRFTTWRRYEHRVRARIGRSSAPLPINLGSIGRLFPRGEAGRLRKHLLLEYGSDAEIPILHLRRSPDATLRAFGEYIYREVYVGYTRKQWGVDPEELDPSVTARVPIRTSHDSRYFQDAFQGLPKLGYTEMVRRMLTHRNIEVTLGTDFHTLPPALRRLPVVYTGPVDRYFDHVLGELPYRSLRFTFRHLECTRSQSSGAITYPSPRIPRTRTTEYKILTGQRVAGTTIGYEYPQAHRPGATIPYYPVPAAASRALYARYARLARGEANVTFCGRLGRYQYLNMDQAVGQALATFNRMRQQLA